MRSFGCRLLFALWVLGIVQPLQGAERRYVEFILDCSRSMAGKLKGGRSKMEEAKDFIRGVMTDLSRWDTPPWVAIRVFGSQSAVEEKNCNDTFLIYPFGPLPDSDELNELLSRVAPKGQTPLGRTIAAAQKDFPSQAREREICLITDGQESCGGDMAAAIRAGPPVALSVVGMDLGSAPKKALARSVNAADGRFLDVADMSALRQRMGELVLENDLDLDLAAAPMPSLQPPAPPQTTPDGLLMETPDAGPSPAGDPEPVVDPGGEASPVREVPVPVAPDVPSMPKHKVPSAQVPVLSKPSPSSSYQRPLRAGVLSLVVPGLGQWMEGHRVRGAATLVAEGGMLATYSAFSRAWERDMDKKYKEHYHLSLVKFGVASTWAAQTIGAVGNFWPDNRTASTRTGALARALVVPGWGLWHKGYHEAAVHVFAWEGFLLYWGTSGAEHFHGSLRDDRRKLRMFNRLMFALIHMGQMVMTDVLPHDGPSVRAGFYMEYDKDRWVWGWRIPFGPSNDL